jgi:PTH1 family peptidyl-tRNA hydrolase
MGKENIDVSSMLVIVDDLALPLGQLRLKPSGSNAGHNGLGNIQSVLGTEQYCRLRVGIGNDFPRGMQVQWVLGKFDEDDMKVLEPKIETACEIIKSFVLAGVNLTMNAYNKKK